MTLRARLFLALLALALIPIAIFTVFTLDQLGQATEHWVRPGVMRALDEGVEVSKSSIARLDALAISHADAWADDWRGGVNTGPARAAQRRQLARNGLDFAQLYERGTDGSWVLVDQLTPAGMLDLERPDLGTQLPGDLEVPIVIHADGGVLAAAAPTADGRVVTAGWWMSPDFFEATGRVADGASHYRQLGLVVALQRNYVWLLVGGLVVVLAIVALLISAALARGMARPLTELAGALERVAAEDLTPRVQPGGAREVRTLGAAFNAMTERLAVSRDAERSAREAERRADLEAREAERLTLREAGWREVARHLAHEIKNPLTAMRYALHRIERRVDRVRDEDRAAMAASVAAILREVNDLQGLAEQFAQYARKPEPRLEPLDLVTLVRETAALQEPEALRLTLPAGAMPVRGDRVLLSRAVQNLLLNAREACDGASPVDLVARAEGPHAVVEVLDRGSGLPEGDPDRWFAPYASTKNRGSGLGLSLVRDVALEHHGGVRLENREGGGAVARLWLPLATSEDPEGPPP